MQEACVVRGDHREVKITPKSQCVSRTEKSKNGLSVVSPNKGHDTAAGSAKLKRITCLESISQSVYQVAPLYKEQKRRHISLLS